MNNKEYTEAYLNWSAEGVDKSLEAFDRHLQAAEGRQTVESVLNLLTGLQTRIGGLNDDGENDAWALDEYEAVVSDCISSLEGDHEYVELSTLGSADVKLVRTK